MRYFLSILVIFTLATAKLITLCKLMGEKIQISKAPYQVAILNGSNHFLCGGSILNHRIIITAAQCIQQEGANNLSIIAGSNHWNAGGQRIEVKDSQARKHYKEGTVGPNNVALLLLRRPLEYSKEVHAIKIALASPKVRDRAFASGWNSLILALKKPNHLHGLEVKISNVSIHYIYTYPFDGDIGGPLVVNKYLVGVSAGFQNMHSVHCNLQLVHNWVRSTAEQWKKHYKGVTSVA